MPYRPPLRGSPSLPLPCCCCCVRTLGSCVRTPRPPPVLPPAPRCLSKLGLVLILKFLYQSIFDSLVLPVTVGSGRNQFYNLEFLEMLLK